MSFDYSHFDTLLEPLFILGEDHKVIYCNETALALCGLTLRKVQKLRFDDLFTFSEKIEWLEELSKVTDPTPYKEVRFTNSEGSEGRVQITCRSFPDDEGARRWIVFVRDVTLEERLQKKYRAELEQKEGYINELQKAQAELEKYSKNLEKMVEERTHEITRLNQQMKALLDSLHQGFLIFGSDGTCFEVSSKACLTVLEGAPAGRAIWDVLHLAPTQVEGFKKWLMTLFGEMLPFEDLAPLGPQFFPHSEGKTIALEYFPLRSESGTIDGVVVVASDITSLVEAKKQAEIERENARLIIKLIKNKKEISRFIRESQSMLESLESILAKKPSDWDRDGIFRALHTIKGGCASFSVIKTAEICHQAEQILAETKHQTLVSRAPELKAKCAEVAQSFHEFVEETKSILGERSLSEVRSVEMPVQELLQLTQKLALWNRGQDLAVHLLQSYIMEPAGSFFEPYKELIQSIAAKEEKMVEELRIDNGDLPVLPEAYSSLFACMVHAFRNGVDHGIEKPQVRRDSGKTDAGQMSVGFKLINRNQTLQIQVVDDGGGINPEEIRQKLRQKGLQTATKSDEEVIQHIFDAEFSTRDVVTDTSGRGVGMDAILSAAKKLGGTAWVQSVLGQGTTLTVEVPYYKEAPVHLATPRPILPATNRKAS